MNTTFFINKTTNAWTIFGRQKTSDIFWTPLWVSMGVRIGQDLNE